MEKTGFTLIDEYIAGFEPEIQSQLQTLRDTIHAEAPDAQEKISYQMPTFYLHGNLVHFAAFKAHIGFYPGAAGIAAFESELQAYQHAKGSVQFPLGQPLPLELVKRIVRFRRAENLNKAAQKSAKK